MDNTSLETLKSISASQKAFFRTGKTLDLKFRKQMLRQLQKAILTNEKAISDALWADLHKSYEESYICETSIVLGEIRNHLRHLKSWSSPKRVPTPLTLFPASSRIYSQPLGCTLIIAPWNYPVQLLLNPLVGAISAGCTAVLKPSPYTPTVSAVLEKIISEAFPKEYIAVVQGNREVNKALLDLRWDLIFFTGSPALGRSVMSAAAKNLTPVILELGGKSPCIVDKDADLPLAARRIAWGKCLNAGQTCIAPDYLLVHEDVKDRFTDCLKSAFDSLYSSDVKSSPHFVRMVSDKAFDRVSSYLEEGTVVYGAQTDASQRFISPTILEGVSDDARVMNEEIFGPVFPLKTVSSLSEALDYIADRERPLALYYYGKNGNTVLRSSWSGGCCINDCIMHIANDNLPFGGVGNSGLGAYHGRLSFDAFSHKRSVVKTSTLIDTPFRYMPYKTFKLVKKLL